MAGRKKQPLKTGEVWLYSSAHVKLPVIRKTQALQSFFDQYWLEVSILSDAIKPLKPVPRCFWKQLLQWRGKYPLDDICAVLKYWAGLSRKPDNSAVSVMTAWLEQQKEG